MAGSSPLWWPWVQRNLDARGWTIADLARAIGAEFGAGPDESVIGRWRNKGAQPRRPAVLAVASVFRRDVREALVAADLVTAEELNAEWADPNSVDLTNVPDELLIDEVRARLTRPRRTTTTRARKRTPASPTNGANRTTVTTTQAGGSRHAVTTSEPTSTGSATADAEPAPSSPGNEDEGAGMDASCG